MLKIPKSIQEALFSQASAADPVECCGLLAGKGKEVTHHYQIKNADQSPTTYLMEPREQFWAFGNMRHNRLDLLAIYHSHTHTPAYPSQTDIRLAYYPECAYIIISLMVKTSPEMKAYKIINGKIIEEPFAIV